MSQFRSIRRDEVETSSDVLSLRIGGSLAFFNARFLGNWDLDRIAERPIRHVVLMCSAVNEVDFSAIETLEALDHRCREACIALHLSEVKGPVMDRLATTHFLVDLSGKVFLSQYDVTRVLAGQGAMMAAE